MAIITISRGSYSRGREVAEQLAKRLGYECISRDILLETCEEFSIPELRLEKALHDAPSLLDRFHQGRERYINCFKVTGHLGDMEVREKVSNRFVEDYGVKNVVFSESGNSKRAHVNNFYNLPI